MVCGVLVMCKGVGACVHQYKAQMTVVQSAVRIPSRDSRIAVGKTGHEEAHMRHVQQQREHELHVGAVVEEHEGGPQCCLEGHFDALEKPHLLPVGQEKHSERPLHLGILHAETTKGTQQSLDIPAIASRRGEQHCGRSKDRQEWQPGEDLELIPVFPKSLQRWWWL